MISFLGLDVMYYFIMHVAIIYTKLFGDLSKFYTHFNRKSSEMQRKVTEV